MALDRTIERTNAAAVYAQGSGEHSAEAGVNHYFLRGRATWSAWKSTARAAAVTWDMCFPMGRRRQDCGSASIPNRFDSRPAKSSLRCPIRRQTELRIGHRQWPESTLAADDHGSASKKTPR